MKQKATISAEELDQKFDAGEDISPYLDWSQARRPLVDTKRINVDVPQWMLNLLDLEARRVGVTRQSIVKMWLAERLKVESVSRGP
jgi:hypothetical protein